MTVCTEGCVSLLVRSKYSVSQMELKRIGYMCGCCVCIIYNKGHHLPLFFPSIPIIRHPSRAFFWVDAAFSLRLGRVVKTSILSRAVRAAMWQTRSLSRLDIQVPAQLRAEILLRHTVPRWVPRYAVFKGCIGKLGLTAVMHTTNLE